MEFLGIRWVGINPENGQKLLLSCGFVALILLLGYVARWLVGIVMRRRDTAAIRRRFWIRQAISLLGAVVLMLGLLSIWFNDPARLATVLGLVSAGLAFALQQPVTSIAGYFVILRGETFNVGDRITMGGVRGDVLRLGFIQTTIMEMGMPPSEQGSGEAIWVKSRQFTGRIVTVSNSRIFSEPVFNYTREFPFIWEEMAIPITYSADRDHMEQIMLAAAREYAGSPMLTAADAKLRLEEQFGVVELSLEPKVYMRITDNWLEMTVRFIVMTHLIRGVKDAMTRQILRAMDEAEIGVASATYDIVGFPELRREERNHLSRSEPSE